MSRRDKPIPEALSASVAALARVCSILTLVGTLVISTTELRAQLTRGSLTGAVTDPSGARIRGANVSLVETRTNSTRETLTSEIGIYRFTAVEPGLYTLEFRAHGFNLRRIQNLPISASREIVLDETLKVADETTQIEVRSSSATAPLDASPANGMFLGQDALNATPFLTTLRDPHLSAIFLPAVARAPAFSGFSAGGQRSRNQNFVVDGVDNNELTVTGSSLRLIPEEISELQIRFPAFSAEFGQSTGTQISVLTMAGANTFHGGVWDYLRFNSLEPLSLVDKRAGFSRSPRFTQNQAGGSLGGPIRANRTFFFATIEANRRREQANSRNASAVTIPTRYGFGQLRDLPLAQGQTLTSRLLALEALSFLPGLYPSIGNSGDVTTRLVNGVPVEFQTLKVPFAAPSNFWHGLFRIDLSTPELGTLTYRLLLDRRSQLNSASNLQFGDLFAASSEILNQNHSASFSHAFSPSWMTENRFSYTRNHLDFPENDPKSPTVQILGLFTFGGLSSFPQGRVANSFQWQHQSSRAWGLHLVKFGADVRRIRLYNLAAFDQKGTWTFNNFSDYLNSQPSRIRHLLSESSYDARQTRQSYFLQDDLRLADNFTINLGLRYELNGVPKGYFGTNDPTLRALGVPGPARKDINNFAPRLGFAFVPRTRAAWLRPLFGDGAFTVRGGYSLNYDVVFFNVLTVTAANYPRALKYDIFAPQTFGQFPLLPAESAQLPTFDPLKFPFANTAEDLQNPTSHHWMLSFQRQLGMNQSIEFGYLGNRTYHLLRQSERNPGILTLEQAEAVKSGRNIPGVQERRANPEWASRATLESTAISKYHGAYLRHWQDFGRGIKSEVSATWSGAFSDNDEPLAIGDIVLSSPQVPQRLNDYRGEWSRSVFDRPLRIAGLFSYSPNYKATKSGHGFLNLLLSDWNFSGSAEWQSGQPFTIITGVDSGGSGISVAWRPDLVSQQPISPDPTSGDLRTFAAPGRFPTPRTGNGTPLANSMPEGGNLGRNTYRGPAFTLWNLNVAKGFHMAERLRLQLRGDLINAWNHGNFGNPVANMNSSSFGSNTTDPGNRAVLLSAKISF